jgi:PTS system mannose-specific IIC component
MILKVIIVSVIGGILCLDRVVLQAMISRPIVAAPAIGLILGDPQTGLIVGAFIELLWIDRLPIGAYIPPNDTIVAVLATASTIESVRLPDGFSQGLMMFAVLLFIPLGILAQKMELWGASGNEKLAREALNNVAKGDIMSISRNHFSAILRTYLLSTCLILITLPVGIGVMTWVYPRLAPWMVRGLTYAYSLFPFIGAAVALNAIKIRGVVPIFCAVFLAAGVAIGFFRGI